jgi:hypothetical protein
LHLGLFEQPGKSRFFETLCVSGSGTAVFDRWRLRAGGGFGNHRTTDLPNHRTVLLSVGGI